MKELSIEEKAKAYDEAKIRISKAYNDNRCTIGFMNEIFPELAESEDEKVKKSLIRLVKAFYDVNFPTPEGFTKEQLLSWIEEQGKQILRNTNKECLKGIKRVQEYQDLSDWEKKFDDIASMYAHNKNQEGYNESWYVKERAAAMLYHAKKELDKQGEQKSTEWSEEDEQYLEDTLNLLEGHRSKNTYGDVVEWLKSLRPQNWAKEDKERYISCFQKLSTGNPEQPETINSKWFKEHVYPKPQWKPSDKQMTALRRMKAAVGGEGEIYEPLNSLYEDLKKLRE